MTRSDSLSSGPDSLSPGPAGGRRGGLARLATSSTVRRQRRVWSGRVASWDRHGSAQLGPVTGAVLESAAGRPGLRVIDLGCGTGQLSLPLVAKGCEVLAVDVSSVMVRQLEAEARRQGLSRLECLAQPIEELALPPESADLIVSSYALHHLRDADKERLVAAAFGWLRPGGRLVLADMMLGRGMSGSDRAIIRSKVLALARKGPGGYWRIAKNAVRFLLRIHERPLPMDRWAALFTRCGFAGVTATSIVAEAGLVTGRRPDSGSAAA